MTGKLFIVGTGPGNPAQMTPEAQDAIAVASEFFGYGPYLDRLHLRADQRRIASDNREELDRARAALTRASAGVDVCVVSGGDPGIFAMAAAVCEAIDTGPEAWRQIDLTITPGVTAMLAVAARIGAPLGHDFCAMSLSDNLKPWEVITRRLRLAAEAGLVIALYNPISKARPWQLGKAFDVLREVLPPRVPVIFGRAAGRPDEHIAVMPLGEADADRADMATCVIIGSPETRIVARSGKQDLVYTPRSFTGDRN
ncbi:MULTISPECIES: precorrin-3B C(17)-methyltransferase [Sinorhizobium]|uniref:precorrin-3B C(17)-methyltransferase n=1 Tax=Sinorhizobium TaxID=28105 RepID=UPI000BE9E3AD|nr:MULTISPECIES: precorrin-3B C(17)-methyltransferase [Sinorhizobium]PDT54097.1 precorrin-3B C(17)-methyltransferase [Sinorhizobium sp. NG07B]POH31154.1 precorrin-3B C(17)-methyltransferase [Sinorhizobium americanum]